ncbi:MAG TPA: hypothetical protein VGW78_02710 [Candidatus Babeliales bacterium]|jgi:hypothetical protein|nr:hypothetical protein [Candidatus Babeliales bacterium]
MNKYISYAHIVLFGSIFHAQVPDFPFTTPSDYADDFTMPGPATPRRILDFYLFGLKNQHFLKMIARDIAQLGLYPAAIGIGGLSMACNNYSFRKILGGSAAILALLGLAATGSSFITNEYMEQIDKLKPRDISNNNIVIIGGMKYVLAYNFDDISHMHDGNHYELYVMPRNRDIFTLFNYLKDILAEYKESIAFIAMDPSPQPLKSCSGKILPRIIIGFKPDTTKEIVESILDILLDLLPVAAGAGGRPWYSDEIKDSGKLLYASFGSGDYKEMPEGQAEYAPMKSTSYWRYITSNIEDMAYKNEGQRLRQSVKNK